MARVNTEQPYTLYETLFGRLLARCQQRAPRHGFRLKNKLFAVDASTIDLCLAAFPWASFRRTKGAIKLHVGLDQAGHLPTFISVTDGKTGDVTVARTWTFPAGSVVVADRAYLDWVRLFFVDGPRGFCERHGKSYLTRRRCGGEGGGGGLLTGRAIPSAYRWAWCRWYSRVVEVPVRIEVAAGFVAPGASEPPRLQPSWPPGGSGPAHG